MEETIKKGNAQDLMEFFGIFSGKKGKEFERNVKRIRAKNDILYRKKIERIRRALS